VHLLRQPNSFLATGLSACGGRDRPPTVWVSGGAGGVAGGRGGVGGHGGADRRGFRRRQRPPEHQGGHQRHRDPACGPRVGINPIITLETQPLDMTGNLV
jgi:hypothetical protein